MTAAGFELPKAKRGRPSKKDVAALEQFAKHLLKIDSTVDFKMSSRGWAYYLEGERLIDKDELDRAESFVVKCRKMGLLPVDFTTEDAKRQWNHVEDLDTDDPDDMAGNIVAIVENELGLWTPDSFWENQERYVEMMVEKIDLVSLFRGTCRAYHIPLANGGGSSDVNVRAQSLRRFKHWHGQGKRCVLLYCGDHDPGGLLISDSLRKNFRDLANSWYESPLDPLGVVPIEIDRFGLNFDFIEKHGLVWIDNLKTNDPKMPPLDDPRHPQHDYDFVQDYLAKYGVRKCEANALVTQSEAARDLCEQAIVQYIDTDAIDEYEALLDERRGELRGAAVEHIREWVTENDTD